LDSRFDDSAGLTPRRPQVHEHGQGGVGDDRVEVVVVGGGQPRQRIVAPTAPRYAAGRGRHAVTSAAVRARDSVGAGRGGGHDAAACSIVNLTFSSPSRTSTRMT